MQLFLHGGASPIRPFDKQLLKDAVISSGCKKLVFVILAIKEPHVQKLWVTTGWFKKGWGDVEVRLVSVYSLDTAAEDVAWADGIFFNGGSQAHLLKSLKNAQLTDVLQTKIDSEELHFLGGESAGAMALGDKVIVGKSEVKRVIPGLCAVDKVFIDSHFSERNRLPRLQAIVDANEGYWGYGLDEGTAIVLDAEGNQKIVGKGSVTVYEQGEVRRYDSGK